MDHYVCTGDCRSVAEGAGMCETADCSNKGKPLAFCNCSDGMHTEVIEKAEAEKNG